MSRFKPEIIKNDASKASNRLFVYAQAESLTPAEAGAIRSEINKQMQQIDEDIEFFSETNALINQALDLVRGFAVVVAGAPFIPVVEKWISHLESLLASTRPFLKLASQLKQIKIYVDDYRIIKNSRFLENLISASRKIRIARAQLGPLFKYLNLAFIGYSIFQLKKKYSEIQSLKNKKDNGDEFETSQEKVSKLEKEMWFECLRLATGIGSYVPGAQKVVAIADGLMLIFTPENVREWGYMSEGFKGGEQEAKKAFEIAKTPLFKDKEDRDNMTFGGKYSDLQGKINNKKVEEVLSTSALSLLAKYSDQPIQNLKKINYKSFYDHIISQPIYLQNKNTFDKWYDTNYSMNIISEYIYVIKQQLYKDVREKRNKIYNEINRLFDIQEKEKSSAKRKQIDDKLREMYIRLKLVDKTV